MVAVDRIEAAPRIGDPARAVMARGLRVISSGVVAQAIGWYPVTPAGDETAGSLVVGHPPSLPDPAQARREWLDRYREDDPFAPCHLLDSRRPLVTMADIGGAKGLASTGYGSEFLPEFGVAYETGLYFRDGGRMLGCIRLGRTAQDGPFSDRDLEFLERAQLMLEPAYWQALAAGEGR